MRPFGNQDHGGSALNRRDRQIAGDIVCFVDPQLLLRDLIQSGRQFGSVHNGVDALIMVIGRLDGFALQGKMKNMPTPLADSNLSPCRRFRVQSADAFLQQSAFNDFMGTPRPVFFIRSGDNLETPTQFCPGLDNGLQCA